jgi:hypothetical protein
MKLFLNLLIVLFLTGCSDNEQRFTCSNQYFNDGLIIKNNIANLGLYSNMNYCDKQGTINIYSSECKSQKLEYYNLFFDTVSYQAEINMKSKDSYNSYSYQCKKLN